MIPSVVINILTAVIAAAAVLAHGRSAPMRIVLRYFTVLSNLLCAAACLAVAAARLSGRVPAGILLFKFVGTAAVTVTLMTVLLFLGPKLYGFKLLFSGPDLWLHLVCPALAIVSLLAWDKQDMPFGAVFLGILPVLLYGGLYLYKVIYAPECRRWEDFYGFNRDGKWPLSFLFMAAGTFIISLLLWLA